MLQPSYTQVAVGYFLYMVSAYLTDIILCALQGVGIRRYVIHGDNDKYRDLVKRLEADTYNSSFIYRRSKMIKTGYFVGPACAGYYFKDPNCIEDEKITLMTTAKYFEKLTADTDTPLVIVLEEANLMIHSVHEGTIERHREIPVPISDKTSWVGFLDNLIFYRNIVVILTSNESKDALDALDPAYLRKGRVDATFSMMTALDISAI